MWKETLPENCPPATAKESNIEVYRILQSNVSTEADFVPYARLYPNNSRYKTLCEAYAISFYDNAKNAKTAYKDALKRNKIIGSFVGKFTLVSTDGRSEYKPSNGHYSVWFYSSWSSSHFNCTLVTSINDH